LQKKCIQQIKKSFALPLNLFMLGFLVGGVTRGKAEGAQTRKVCRTQNVARGNPSGAEVDQPGQKKAKKSTEKIIL
jgi:hypothetical protein